MVWYIWYIMIHTILVGIMRYFLAPAVVLSYCTIRKFNTIPERCFAPLQYKAALILFEISQFLSKMFWPIFIRNRHLAFAKAAKPNFYPNYGLGFQTSFHIFSPSHPRCRPSVLTPTHTSTMTHLRLSTTSNIFAKLGSMRLKVLKCTTSRCYYRLIPFIWW